MTQRTPEEIARHIVVVSKQADASSTEYKLRLNITEAISAERIIQDELRSENIKLKKEWLLEPDKSLPEGFWGRSCARLSDKVKDLQSLLALKDKALAVMEEALEYYAHAYSKEGFHRADGKYAKECLTQIQKLREVRDDYHT